MVTPSHGLQALALIPVFAEVGEAERAALLRGARKARLIVGQQLMAKGEKADTLALLLSGRLCVSAGSMDGRSVTFRHLDPVEMVGEIGVFDGGLRTADVTAVTDCRLLLLPAEEVRGALQLYPALSMAMLRLVCGRLRDTTERLERVSTQLLPARLAHLLLRLAAEFGQLHPDGAISLPMRISQTEMGTLVAASREAVNKQVRQWRQQGLVEHSRGCLLLRHPARLAALTE